MEWNIQSRSRACQSCKRGFADKEPFHTLLFDQKHGYERFDVCEACWTAQYGQGAADRKGFVSYWQSLYAVPPAAPPEAIQRETAETLLRKLAEANDPKHIPALYILGAMLERKRILKVKAQLSRDGVRVFVYEHAKTGDLLQIQDPNLQLHQLAAVQHEVLHLLQHGLGGEAAADVVSSGASDNLDQNSNQNPNPEAEADEGGGQEDLDKLVAERAAGVA